MTHAITLLAPAFLAGALLAGVYLGALWLTVQRLPRVRYPAGWLVGSWIARTALLLGGLYLFTAGHWERLLACLLGFLVTRTLVLQRMRPPAAARIRHDA
jgi:F1F0 ATPase subunit 2